MIRRFCRWIQIKDIRDKEAVYQKALEREFVYNLRESVKSADNMRGLHL